jgi:diguanylate cyclase (GGDEF)-like protein/PAS domain S-box-containing protein
LPGPHGQVRASITDISARKRAELITAGDRNVFEQIAADASLPTLLGAIVKVIESVCPDYIATISQLTDDGRSFAEVIGERLPATLRNAEEHSAVDIRNGSAAAAVYLGRQVLASNIAADPYWLRRREIATDAGLASAWAVPIKTSSGRVLGAVAVYHTRAGLPASHDLELFQHAARLAAVAIERRRAEIALRTSEAKFRGLYESVLEGVYQCGPEGQIQAVNPAFVKMLGFESAEAVYALPSVATLYWTPAERAALEQRLDVEGEVHNAEVLLRRRDGQQVVALESARVLRDANQRIVAFEGTVADITARKRAEQAVFAEKERAQVTLQSIGDAVITTDSEGRIDYMNPVAEQLSGWTSAEARGQAINQVLRLLDEVSREDLENPLLRCLREGKVVDLAEQSVLMNRKGQEIAIQDSAAPIRDRAGNTVGAVVVFRDVTKERRLKRALSYQAVHDALTGLINRREFDNRLQNAVQSARNGEGPHALLYVDLDQFKVINDTCGHSAGDRLLRDVTALLQQQVRAADTIARLGGDEFGILVQHCSIEQAVKVADGIRQAVHDYRFNWDQNSTSIGASIGVVEITRDCESVASLLSAADIACYAAKDSGRNRVHIYESGEASGRHREMYWVSRVTRAVDEGRIELYHQPIVPTAPTAESPPLFHELFVRLRGDGGALIMPGEFIPAAERYNVISAIDRWVVKRAVEVLDERHQLGLPPTLLLAVNLSGTSLSERSFLDYVLSFAEEPRVGRGLCFEITETAVITNMAQAVYFMRELKKRGCRFALDDFGSGLSSFHYLKTLPVDYLKIDGEFIANVANDPVDRSMIEAIGKVAGALGIATIAEKVESATVHEQLARLGVDFVQGFLVARPQPIDGLAAIRLPQ